MISSRENLIKQGIDKFNNKIYNVGMKKSQPRILPFNGLPNQLRRLRIQHGDTLKAVADLLGVSVQAVHQAETKGVGINRQKWYMLADRYDIDPRELEKPAIFSPEYQVST